MCGGEIILQSDRRVQAGDCLVETAAVQQRPAERAVRRGIPRVEIGRPAQGGDSSSEFARLEEPRSLLPMSFGVDPPSPRQWHRVLGAGTGLFREQSGGGRSGLHLPDPFDNFSDFTRFC